MSRFLRSENVRLLRRRLSCSSLSRRRHCHGHGTMLLSVLLLLLVLILPLLQLRMCRTVALQDNFLLWCWTRTSVDLCRARSISYRRR